MKIRYKKLYPDAKTPVYATEGAACFDLFANERAEVSEGAATLVGSGLAVQVPSGYALLIYSRSGMGSKYGVRLANCTGVIDSDYRGEVMIALTCDRGSHYFIKKGDAIAQGMIVDAEQVRFEEGELSETKRGSGGFGSTG